MKFKDDGRSTNTQNLLYLISNHLSGRECCRGIEYTVIISENQIQFQPDVKVYPNRYRKSKYDQMNVVDHIIQDHLIVQYCRDVDGSFYVDTDRFVRGKYIYKSLNRNRRWVKLV